MRMTPNERETIKLLVDAGCSMAQIGLRVQRSASWVWEQVYNMRRKGELDWPNRTITLPKVSILETPSDLTNADYYAGKAAQAAAGLS